MQATKKTRRKMQIFRITEIDAAINSNTTDCQKALVKVARHIQKKIDSTFPEQEFIDWANSSTTKPFRWNRKRYDWD